MDSMFDMSEVFDASGLFWTFMQRKFTLTGLLR